MVGINALMGLPPVVVALLVYLMVSRAGPPGTFGLLYTPTESRDPAATLAVEDVIAAVHGSGTKIVMTTHDLAQARRVADDVLFLYRGRLFEHSPAGVFFEAPKPPRS